MVKLRRCTILMSLLFVMTGALSAQGDSDSAARTETIQFPEIPGWEMTEVNHYSPSSWGYSVGYNSRRGGAVTIYVYDRDIESIPDGIESELVKTELKSVIDEIFSLQRRGIYEDVTELKDDSVTLGDEKGTIKALRSVLGIKDQGNQKTSETYLFGLNGKFIKIRTSRAEEIEEIQNREVTEILNTLGTFFAAKKTNINTP